MIFTDRLDAGCQLAERLQKFKGTDAVIIAIPRGGVPLGKVIAERLDLPLDVILVKKLSHPAHREYAIGAVSLSNVVLSDVDKVSEQYIEAETIKVRKMLQDRYRKFYVNRKPLSLKDRIVIVVDDGIATGLTLQSTIKLIQQQLPEKIVVAIPVASRSGKELMSSSPLVDEIVCLHTPADFRSVSRYYEDFDQVSDEEVEQLLE